MSSGTGHSVQSSELSTLRILQQKGSGFEKIISGYEFQINYTEEKKPSFRSDRYQFTVIMPNLNYGIEMQNQDDINAKTENNVAKVVAKNGVKMDMQKNKVIESIQENSRITQSDLATILGVSKRTVQRITEELVKENKIARVGSRRAGTWKILK